MVYENAEVSASRVRPHVRLLMRWLALPARPWLARADRADPQEN